MDISLEVSGIIAIIISLASIIMTRKYERMQNEIDLFEKILKQFNEYFSSTNEVEIEQTLGLLNQVCYYKEEKLISEKQFYLFKDRLAAYWNRPNVKVYVQEQLDALRSDVDKTPYRFLLNYVERHLNDIAPALEQDALEVDVISEADFVAPTMIIKINSSYREGMSVEDVYNITRQWWRVDRARAQKMKYALAVAHGIVKEVFEIDTWHRGSEKDECPGRWSFDGRVANDVTRRRFVNKSVKQLFKKGAVFPIRYFDGGQ